MFPRLEKHRAQTLKPQNHIYTSAIVSTMGLFSSNGDMPSVLPKQKEITALKLAPNNLPIYRAFTRKVTTRSGSHQSDVRGLRTKLSAFWKAPNLGISDVREPVWRHTQEDAAQGGSPRESRDWWRGSTTTKKETSFYSINKRCRQQVGFAQLRLQWTGSLHCLHLSSPRSQLKRTACRLQLWPQLVIKQVSVKDTFPVQIPVRSKWLTMSASLM